MKKKKTGVHFLHNEMLGHFSCGSCKKWWTIGDAPRAKTTWFCPWCGAESTAKQSKNKK